MELTAQINGENQKLSSNPEASGRFHTAWLNMMYPRLKVARNLLSNNGVILISIGDEELHNLRVVCDEIFGYENFCGIFIWEKKKKPSFLDRNMGTVTDYIVSYAKDRAQSPAFTTGSVKKEKKYPFNNAGNNMAVLEFPAGSVTFGLSDQIVTAQDMSEGNIKTELLNDVRIEKRKNSNAFRLRGEWRYSQSKLDEFVAVGADVFISKIPFRPNYVNRSGDQKKMANLLSYRINATPTNEDATQQAREIFGADVVSYPKPEGLLKYLIGSVSRENDIILDFFSGSGTTASGVWRQNAADSCSRRFIIVQLPQPLDTTDKTQTVAADFCDQIGRPRNLVELTKEWLRRSAKQIQRETPLFTGDFGFLVLKLDTSNIQSWIPKTDNLERSILEHVENIKEGRTDQDILFELMLKLGLDLCTSIESRMIAERVVYSVGGGTLFACLEQGLTPEEAQRLGFGIASWKKELSPLGESTAIFRDNGFVDDKAKLNLTAVLEQSGIANIRSL